MNRVRPLAIRERTRERIRAAATVVTDPVTGLAEIDVYNVPAGFTFEARRVQWDGGFIADDGSNLSNAASIFSAGTFMRYLRSGQLIEIAKPNNLAGITNCSVPGIQTWADEQGPQLTGGETFQVRFALTSAAARGQSVTVTVEGILSQAGSAK